MNVSVDFPSELFTTGKFSAEDVIEWAAPIIAKQIGGKINLQFWHVGFNSEAETARIEKLERHGLANPARKFPHEA